VMRALRTADVRHAFRSCALICHPDKGGSKEAFQQLSRAYRAVLACCAD
jgi:DnaJ-class molecular chaperone